MESLTIELTVAEGDPYDRVLSVMAKRGRTIDMVRTMRVAPTERIGSILLTIDRLALAWATPQLPMSEHIHDVWEQEERRIGYGPF